MGARCVVRDAEPPGRGWRGDGRRGAGMGQQQQCHHGVHRPVGNLAPCRASRLAQPWGQVTELGCCQLRTEGCRREEVVLKAGGCAGSPDLRAGGRRTHCVIPGEYSRGDRLMHSLPASPGADSLAADSSRPGASIPQDTFLAFGLGAHPRLPSALTPRPQALPTPRSCCRASTLASLPPPSPPPPPAAALEGLRAAS